MMASTAFSASHSATGGPGAAIWRGNTPFLAGVLLFSVLVNLLMLTGPLFMLQLYDRVLASRSDATLLALFALVGFLYLMLAMLDHARGRIAARIGAAFQTRLDRRVFDAALRRQAMQPADSVARLVQQDLEAVQKLLGAPIFLALFDVPWTPLFIALIFAFHPEMGWLALGGGTVLVVLALINQRLLQPPLQQLAHTTHEAERFRNQIGNEAEVTGALGMRGSAYQRWQNNRHAALCSALAASDRAGFFTAATKSFRLFLQSAMLALGAWLVLRDQVTPGLMIAASIILGRALAPVEQVVGQWGVLQGGWQSWKRLGAMLAGTPPDMPRMALPRPRAHLSLRGVTVIPPGDAKAALRLIDFNLQPGRAVGVIGPSGAGKSTLARTVTGAWQPAAGKLRLDGVALDQFEPDALGRLLGYLPQRVTLFDGTVAGNIARLDPSADPAEIVRAARLAGAHDMIVALPDGYDTRICEHAGRLSGGQVQRIGLARALYGNPVLLVLDEPNSNLDADGSQALNTAIRSVKARGASVMIMAHRPAAIQECDDLLVLEHGAQTAFGPRDQVLRQVVRNHTDLVRAPPQAGGHAADQSAAGGGE